MLTNLFRSASLHRPAGRTAAWSPPAGLSPAQAQAEAAQIKHDGKNQFVGHFAPDGEATAARAYDAAARRLRGDRAHGGRQGWHLNFPTVAELAACTGAAAAPVNPSGNIEAQGSAGSNPR